MRSLLYKYCAIGLIVMLTIISLQSSAQQLFHGKVIEPSNEETEALATRFSERTVFQLDIEKLSQFVQNNGDFSAFTLQIGDAYTWDIELVKNELRSPDYYAIQMTNDGPVLVPPGPCITYRGNLQSDPEAVVRLGIDENLLDGYVWQKDGFVFIEPGYKYGLNTPGSCFSTLTLKFWA